MRRSRQNIYHRFCQKTCTIVKINDGDAPKIDGDLTDGVWNLTKEYGDFTLLEPNPGGQPSQPTYFKLLYDNTAFYVYAKMVDNPENILKELAQRDNYNNTDFIGIIFDPAPPAPMDLASMYRREIFN